MTAGSFPETQMIKLSPAAASAPGRRALVRPSSAPHMVPVAANDDITDAEGEALLRAALRLFANHGLGAARHAQTAAETAFFGGDRESYRWWLAVTRTLDRKLAVELSGRIGGVRFGNGALPTA